MLCFCFYSFLTIFQKDPLFICVGGALVFDKTAYPTCFGPIEDGFSTIMGYDPSIFSLEGFNHVSSPEDSSDTEVTVEDFGAKGDGTDDTKVPINRNMTISRDYFI